MAAEQSLQASPKNPFLGSSPFASCSGLREALSNCSNHLFLMADLFGFDEEMAGYQVLATREGRYGLWTQLYAIADLLRSASRLATIDPSRTVFNEVVLPFSEGDYRRLEAAARHSDRTVDDYVSVLTNEFIQRFGEGVTK